MISCRACLFHWFFGDKCAVDTSIPYFKINAPLFFCPLFFKVQTISQLPGQDKQNGKRK